MKNELKKSRLLTRQLKMAQLEAVSAGAEEEEEPEEVIWEWLVMFLVYLLFAAFSALIVLGFAELFEWVIKHEFTIVSAIAASGHPKEAKAYKSLSRAQKEQLWREVHARIKH